MDYNNNNNYNPNDNNQINMNKLNIKKKNYFFYKLVFFIFVGTILFLSGGFFANVSYKNNSDEVQIIVEPEKQIVENHNKAAEKFAEKLSKNQSQNQGNLSFQEEFFGYTGLVLNTLNSSIIIETTGEDEDCTFVDISNKRYNDFYIYQDGDILVIDELENSSASNIKLNISSLNINFIHANSVRGHIEIKDTDANSLDINSTNGNIIIKSSDLESLNIGNISGNIHVDEVNSIKSIDISSTSGNVLLTDSNCPNLMLKNISGNIELKDTKTENINASTISGFQRIQLKKSDLLNVHLDTISNNIDCKFDERQVITNNSQTRIDGDFKFDKNSDNVFIAFSQSGTINAN